MILVCHFISLDHVIIWSRDFVGRNPSRYVAILPSLVDIGPLVVDIIYNLPSAPDLLFSFESTPLDVPVCQIWWS